MSAPWKDKSHVVSDLDQLCDMYDPKDKKAPIPNIKLLTMEKNPSPETVRGDDTYLPHGIDLTDDDLDIEPDFNFITTMLRSVAPSYSNDCIEEAFGHQGRLLDQSRQVMPHQTAKNSKHSAGSSKQHSVGSSKRIPAIDVDGDSLRTQLNPYSGEFVPLSQYSNVPSGDSVEPIHTKTPEKKLPASKLNPHTPEFKPAGRNQGANYENILSVKPSTSSATVNAMSLPDKSELKSEPYRHPATEPSLNVNPKMKRNCAMQNMFQRLVEGEPADTIANIEFNPTFVQKHTLEESAVNNPATMDGGNKLNYKSPTETAPEGIEIFDDSSETTEDSATAAKELLDARLVYGFVEPRSAPQSSSVAGPSHGYRKHISSDSKNKVLSWLSSDCKSNKIDATRNFEIPEPIKPNLFELDDEAFTFIKRNQSFPEDVRTANIPESIPEESIVNSESEEASASGAQSPQPKKLSVQEIYNNLKAKQERKFANNANNTTSTYESYVNENRNSPSSNTIWDTIKVYKNKTKPSKDWKDSKDCKDSKDSKK